MQVEARLDCLAADASLENLAQVAVDSCDSEYVGCYSLQHLAAMNVFRPQFYIN